MELQITQTWYPQSDADGRMDGRRDRQSGTTTRPTFSKASQVKIGLFRVTGLKILDRVGTHVFFCYFVFPGKNIHFEKPEGIHLKMKMSAASIWWLFKG